MTRRRAYYNEIEPYCAQWLRNLIAEGLIPAGDVDDRSILEVQPGDLAGYGQCHFFAGLGGWAYALRLAGVADDAEVWTGSCPCQPLSSAGQRKGHADERHLWPAFFALVAQCRPAVLFGEQVASKDGREWLAGVRADLETVGYACGAANLPACSVGAPHRRERLWFVADAADEGEGRRGLLRPGEGGGAAAERASGEPAGSGAVAVGDADSKGPSAPEREAEGRARGRHQGGATDQSGGTPWEHAVWLVGADGKSRRVGPGLRLLAHGIPGRVGQLRALGNAIVPQVAAAFVSAALEKEPPR